MPRYGFDDTAAWIGPQGMRPALTLENTAGKAKTLLQLAPLHPMATTD